ncbi:hypothetical protein Acr_00g0001970 [Actinidia rufa]|uniref:Uncharacterized protein n=1 Tax=Actinidia rufa TaxID=165716 RepID=A0A7J0D858_9ERIC|nr:hypothetical protein Acr_00g0001920 [Actinidia rufa]GFS28463.1 hypothetical protein Acr_00g0001970 [Actinidia rufa]
MGARAANTTRRKVRLECMLAEPSGDPESRIGIRRLRKRMLWFFRFLASRPPVPLPAPVILAAWRCTPDWEPLPKKSLKATGRARQKEMREWTTCNILLQRLRKAPPYIRTESRDRRTRFVATTTSTRSTIIGPLEKRHSLLCALRNSWLEVTLSPLKD